LHYISSGEEMDEMDEITSDARLDQWLDRFWRMRDLTPDTKLNEARIEYEKRVEMANGLFSTPRHLGILTEPGRVLAVYGMPDVQLQDHSIYDDRVQYLLYVYNGRLRDVTFAAFLFRRSSAEEWRQVYSNVPGEVSGGSMIGLPPQMQRWIGL
jgi:GWxTD domain-containing protein